MIICGFDLETTGLDPKNDVVTEIGAVLWDTDKNAPVLFFNKLLKIDRPVPEFIVKLTGITDELLQKYGVDPATAWEEFKQFQALADYSMAHNSPFDDGFVDIHCPNFVRKNSTIDSSVDVPYSDDISTRKLVHLAAEHAFVNPFAHRAVTDVLTMFQVVSNYDWNEIVESSKHPVVKLQAKVTYNDNQKAKGNGYRWNPEAKQWIKFVKENKFEAEVAKCLELGFNVKRLG